MALDEGIPIDGDGVSTGTLVSQICTAIRALRTAINAGGVDKINDDDGDTGFWTEETADKDEIQGKVAGVEAFRIHDSGIQDLPKQSSIKVWNCGNQTISNATETKVQLASVAHDIQNEYDEATNYRFTAKEAGRYVVVGYVYWANTTVDTKRNQVRIRKNDAWAKIFDFYWTMDDVFASLAVTDILDLDASDYIELWVWHVKGASINLRGLAVHETSLSIQKMS